MPRIVEWGGQPFALLIESEDGDYLVPPIVVDEHGNTLEGRQVLEAVAASGVTIEMPIVRGGNSGILAEVDRRMALLSDELGVPIAGAAEPNEPD